MMKLKRALLIIGLGCVSLSVYAADPALKEQTIPSTPEGAITVEQIPPIYDTKK